MSRIYNFAAGPGMLPEAVLEEVSRQLVDYQSMGMSLLEMSHRDTVYGKIHEETKALIRKILSVPETHDILLLQGGGHTQFAMVPLNLLGAAAEAHYITNGVWSRKAATEAGRWAHVNSISPAPGQYVTDDTDLGVPADSGYLYYCQNETVNGIEFNHVPQAPARVPLVADVSSNFLSRPIDFQRHALVFAGAQKNFGPAGLAVVILNHDLYGLAPGECPTMLNYAVHGRAGSLYNTPPTFAIWVANRVCHWILDQGGLEVMQERAQQRSMIVYEAIDSSGGFYVNPIPASCRSRMNVVFSLRDAALTDLFVRAAEGNGLANLRGHRLVGGLRASLYNAMPVEGAKALASFMGEFAQRHG